MDDNFDFETDFDFENENQAQSHPLMGEIERLIGLFDKYRDDFEKAKEEMEKQMRGGYFINPIVLKTIVDLKNYLKNECGIENENIKVSFNKLFNALILEVRTKYWGIPGTESKREFDSLFQRCQGFDVTHLSDGNTQINFLFYNALVFTNTNKN